MRIFQGMLLTGCLMLIGYSAVQAQYPVFRGCPAVVDFSKTLRDWDGFGFNYVETAQTIDYDVDAKDYGGFSIMTEKSREEIIDLIFGDNGLKVGLVKMFLDPFHQNGPGGRYDHERSTANMRLFVRTGLEKTRSSGRDLQIITTLYGPPAYMTLQKVMRGRDLDPVHKNDLARYLIDWAKFLKEKEKLPIRYISLHNEGEDWERWPWDGSHTGYGINYLRSLRPELHAWVTSTSWSRMDSRFIKEIWGNIYEAGINGLIPWAGMQRPPLWVGGDPNPGCAIRVSEDGSYEIQPGYYYYKQVSRAGQPGMKVAYTMSMDSEIPVIAFSGGDGKNSDAFVIVNTGKNNAKPVEITVKGTKYIKLRIYRTNGKDELYREIGEVQTEGGVLFYIAPPDSATTFFGIE